MSSSSPKQQPEEINISTRDRERYAGYRDLHITYEGSSIETPVRAPDISRQGMFINTGKFFPEGTVIKVQFRLTRMDQEVKCRAEVRYCLNGVGIGVQFLDITPEQAQSIEDEMTAK